MIAATLLLAGCTTLVPPNARETSYVELISPPDGAVDVPRDHRLFISDTEHLLDPVGDEPAWQVLQLVDDTGAVIPHTRDDGVVTPELLPASRVVSVYLLPTPDHPCQECFEDLGPAYQFTTSDVIVGDAPLVTLSRPIDLEREDNYPPIVNSCSVGSAEGYIARHRVDDLSSRDLARLVVASREKTFVSWLHGLNGSRATGPVDLFGGLKQNTEHREPIFVGVVVIPSAGKAGFVDAAIVLPRESEELAPTDFGMQCRVGGATVVDTPATYPKNGVVRARFFAERRPFSLDQGASLDIVSSAGPLEVLRLPDGIAAGEHALGGGPCPSCSCTWCAVEARVVVVDDFVDTTAPSAPEVVAVARETRGFHAGGPSCEAYGDVVAVTVTPSLDDHTPTQDLVYDVRAGAPGGPQVTLATALQGEIVDDELLLIASLRMLPESVRDGPLDVTVVARDLADNASAPSEASAVAMEMPSGCTCVAPPTTRAPFAVLALPLFALLRRRLRTW